MTNPQDNLFVRIPGGEVKGPFEARKVVKTYRAGRVPIGSKVASHREGPWIAVGAYARVYAQRSEQQPAAPQKPAGPVRPAALAAHAERDSLTMGMPYRTVAAVTIEAPVRRSSSLGVSVPAQAGESARAVEHAAAESVVLAAQTAAPEASPAPIMLPTAPAEARVSPDAKLTFGDLIARSFEQMTKHYRAVLLRTLATFALAGALLALPTVVWIASFLAERYVDLSGYPWLSGLLASTFYIQLIAPMVLVPFGLMFLVCGVLCVLGAIEGSEWSRWGSLFAWRRRFLPMMILGYVAAGTEVASFLLTAFLFDPKASNTNIIESTLSRCIEACPIVLCLLAGMLVMTTESTRGVFGRVGRALKWASARLLESRASTLPALGTVLLIAVLCAILILPLPFLGLPVFFVAIGLGFRTFEPPVEA